MLRGRTLRDSLDLNVIEGLRRNLAQAPKVVGHAACIEYYTGRIRDRRAAHGRATRCRVGDHVERAINACSREVITVYVLVLNLSGLKEGVVVPRLPEIAFYTGDPTRRGMPDVGNPRTALNVAPADE